MLSIVILRKNVPFFFTTPIFDGCFGKYKLNMSFSNNSGGCHYFLEYELQSVINCKILQRSWDFHCSFVVHLVLVTTLSFEQVSFCGNCDNLCEYFHMHINTQAELNHKLLY